VLRVEEGAGLLLSTLLLKQSMSKEQLSDQNYICDNFCGEIIARKELYTLISTKICCDTHSDTIREENKILEEISERLLLNTVISGNFLEEEKVSKVISKDLNRETTKFLKKLDFDQLIKLSTHIEDNLSLFDNEDSELFKYQNKQDIIRHELKKQINNFAFNQVCLGKVEIDDNLFSFLEDIKDNEEMVEVVFKKMIPLIGNEDDWFDIGEELIRQQKWDYDGFNYFVEKQYKECVDLLSSNEYKDEERLNDYLESLKTGLKNFDDFDDH
jgi:hypothetical protein